MNKILSKYNILHDDKCTDQEKQSLNTVIKVPVYQKDEMKIDYNETLNKPKEPKLHLTRNNEGVVVGIEVLCVCGEKILIKMDYK
jgi:hypothetical protein